MKFRYELLGALMIVLMKLVEEADAWYTRRIYRHRKLPHGWEE